MLFDERLPFSVVVLLEDVTSIEIVDLKTQDKAIKALIYVKTDEAMDLFKLVGIDLFAEMYPRTGGDFDVDINNIDVEKEIAELRIMLKK